MDIPTRGRGVQDARALTGHPHSPWHRISTKGVKDKRLFPIRGGGRRMRHPFMEDLVYPQLPDITLNFGYDPLRRSRAVVVKTFGSTAVADFPDEISDVVIREIWQANQLSAVTKLYHHFYRFRTAVLPMGRFIGWQPKDLSPKGFFVRMLDVSLGQGQEYRVEELGKKRPVYIRETLSVTFKLIAEAKSPPGVVIGEGI